MSKRKAAIMAAYEKGYRVTDDGRVLSPKGRELSLFQSRSGRPYKRFTIYFDGGPVCLDVHRLAGYQKFGEAIFGDGSQVRHLDDNALNNNYENIGIGSPSENAHDMPLEKRSFRSSIGGYSGGRANRVFTKEEIFSILERFDMGESQLDIANSVNVGRRTINRICNGGSYIEWYQEYRNS